LITFEAFIKNITRSLRWRSIDSFDGKWNTLFESFRMFVGSRRIDDGC